MIKEYKNIKDNYSWNEENEGELEVSKPSAKIYDLRTPLKKSRKDDTVSIFLFFLAYKSLAQRGHKLRDTKYAPLRFASLQVPKSQCNVPKPEL